MTIDVLFVPLYFGGLALFDSGLDWFWDLNVERSVATWYSSLQLALAACLLLALFAMRREKRATAVLLAIAGCALLFLSLDELVGLHERFAGFVETVVGDRRETGLNRSGAWVLFVGPAFIIACALAAYFAREHLRRRRREAILFGAGALVLVTSFAGVELVGNFVGKTAHLLVLVPTEEIGEMVGGTLFVWAAYSLVESSGLALLTRPPSDVGTHDGTGRDHQAGRG